MAVFAQYPLRLPLDVKAFIEAEAKENASSQNSEIVRAIRGAMSLKERQKPRCASVLTAQTAEGPGKSRHSAMVSEHG